MGKGKKEEFSVRTVANYTNNSKDFIINIYVVDVESLFVSSVVKLLPEKILLMNIHCLVKERTKESALHIVRSLDTHLIYQEI